MDWFERLTGFPERDYAETQAKLVVEGERLRSVVNGRTWQVGRLTLPSLSQLRAEVGAGDGPTGRLRVRNISGDVRGMHLDPEHRGALFQVASQFNMLEMTGPSVTPEAGVTRYAFDRTQGPACAQAAGAATLFRNYFVQIGDQVGQTAERQLDGLADLGAELSAALGRPVSQLWIMQNGYALCTEEGLAGIAQHLVRLDHAGRDDLRSRLRVGLHCDVEVTDGDPPGPLVSQVFCSALPVAYGRQPRAAWRAFAELVLEAAYEATLWAAVLNARSGRSDVVLLTRLGGGAFGNEDTWIDRAMARALTLADGYGLDVRLVSYGSPTASMLRLER